MKKLSLILAAALMCASLAACSSGTSSSSAAASGSETASASTSSEATTDDTSSGGTLIMGTNAAFPPYEYYENDEIVGIDADMAQAVCDVLGYDLVIEDMEFDAIINAIQSGKADIGVAGITVTEDRQQSVDFTDSYATSKQVIIVKE